jgi:hypothetical protein
VRPPSAYRERQSNPVSYLPCWSGSYRTRRRKWRTQEERKDGRKKTVLEEKKYMKKKERREEGKTVEERETGLGLGLSHYPPFCPFSCAGCLVSNPPDCDVR